MTFREFTRFHLLKTLLVLIVIQLGIFAYVQNYNHRPQAHPDLTSVFEGKTVRVMPLANDSDKDEKDTLSLKQVFSPIHGSTKKVEEEIFYTPVKNFVGKDSFAYTISDGRKESEKSFVVISVKKNLEPLAAKDDVQVFNGESAVFDVLSNDADREGDSLIVKEFSQPLHGKVKMLGNQLVYHSVNSSARADSFLYAVSDGKNSSKATVRVHLKSKNDPCYPWLSADLGDAAQHGSFALVNKNYAMAGSGSDIWNNSDGCRFAWQYVTGNCEMYTKILKLEGNHPWTKAGIMVRESLAGNSRMAYVLVSTKNGATLHQRYNTNEQAEGGDKFTEAQVPYWVKIIRKENTFSYFISKDGANWKNIGTAVVVMPKNVYIGFAVTSHNNKETSKAVFGKYVLNARHASFDDLK